MKNAKAKVYIDFINYKGDVTDHVLIAEFRNENWADHFLHGIPHYDDGIRYVKEVVTK